MVAKLAEAFYFTPNQISDHTIDQINSLFRGKGKEEASKLADKKITIHRELTEEERLKILYGNRNVKRVTQQSIHKR